MYGIYVCTYLCIIDSWISHTGILSSVTVTDILRTRSCSTCTIVPTNFQVLKSHEMRKKCSRSRDKTEAEQKQRRKQSAGRDESRKTKAERRQSRQQRGSAWRDERPGPVSRDMKKTRERENTSNDSQMFEVNSCGAISSIESATAAVVFHV